MLGNRHARDTQGQAARGCSEPASSSNTSIPARRRNTTAAAAGGPLPITTTRLSFFTRAPVYHAAVSRRRAANRARGIGLPRSHTASDTAPMRLRAFGTTICRSPSLAWAARALAVSFKASPRASSGCLQSPKTPESTSSIPRTCTAREKASPCWSALATQRARVVIATKAGYCLPGRRKLAGRLKPILRPLIRALGIRRDRLPAGAGGVLTQDFSPSYLARAVEASLRRLRTDSRGSFPTT